MQIALGNTIARRVAIALEVLVFLATLAWIAKTVVADWIAQGPTVSNLRLAAKLDPGNSDYHLRLGRMFQYSVTDIDPDLAISHLKRAVELSPYDARPWLELGAALQLQGETVEAAKCLRRADFLAPNIPSVQWAIGNFFLLQGNVDEAFRHFRVVLAGSSRYNQILFSTAWKASGDPEKILRKLIPRHLPSEMSYLYFLVFQQRYPEARVVWQQIMANPEIVPANQAGRYIDELIRARRPGEAHRIWRDLIQKGSLKRTYESPRENLITNAGFEEELLKMGFDWRINQVQGAHAAPDRSIFHSPGTSLHFLFTGKENVNYRHAFQYVKVEPGRTYRLRAYMKTEGITTDSGPRLEVRDAFAPAVLRMVSEGLTGTSGGWVPLTLDFTTGSTTELVLVAVVRFPSRKFDNLIAGMAWIDDLSLVPLPAEISPQR